MSKNIIGVDLDGVLCQFEDYAIEHFGPGNRTFFRLEDRWPSREIEIYKFIHNPRTYLHLEPIQELLRTVKKYSLLGEIVIVTSRPATRPIQHITKWWLDRHLVPYNGIVFIETSGMRKTEIAKMIKACLFFEDNPTDLLELQAENIPTITVDWPYNRNVPGARILPL